MRTVRLMACMLAWGIAAPPVLAQTLPRDVRLRLLEAVVQIVPYDDVAGATVDWSGSGTVISPDGYVLTNFHVAGDLDSREHFEWFAILTTATGFTDQPPVFRYWARYVAGDPTHDLALLRIAENADETPIPAGTVFPHATVGDSNLLIPGDPLTIVGYPGISGSTVTFTSGLMSGWVGEDFESGGKQWIKTDGKIAHGNSGGGAFDSAGNLIGVPTAGRTVRYDELDVEEQAYVRPIALAWSLLGPNAPTVARAGGGSAAAERGAPEQAAAGPATPQPLSEAAAGDAGAVMLGADCDNCMVGALRLGGNAYGAILATEGGVDFHTYTVVVPAGTTSLTVTVEADADVDVALKFGSEILSYATDGDWDFIDVEESFDPTIQLANPQAGVWFIDVFNQIDGTTVHYTMSVR